MREMKFDTEIEFLEMRETNHLLTEKDWELK